MSSQPASSSSKPDLPPPVVSLAFSNAYLPTNYDLSLDISSKANYMGLVVMDLAPNERASFSGSDPFQLVLNAVELVVTDAYLLAGSQHKLKVEQNRKKETVRFSTDITFDSLQNEQLRLRVHFIGVVRGIASMRDFTKGVFKTKYKDGANDRYIISTHCQPSFARLIFPCVDDVLVKTSFKLSLTADEKFTCVSNTPIESASAIGQGRQLVVFEASPKMTTSVFSFAVGEFDFLEEKIDLPGQENFPLRVYTQIGESGRAKLALATVKSTLPKLVQKFGVEYPIAKFDVIALPFLSDGGVENWSMIQILKDHLLTPDSASPAEMLKITSMIKNVLVHEMVHMFMGDLVTFESYDYTWLNEAFATFMSNTVLNEESDDNQVWFDQLANDAFNMKRYQGLDNMKPIHTENVPADTIQSTFSKHSYDKGIFVLRMLAGLFNETPGENYDSFFSAVGDFINKNKYGLFKPADLWIFLKEHPLNKFKHDIPTIMFSWTRTAGYPILKVSTRGEKLLVEQHRFLYNPESKVEDVPYQVPLLVKNSDGTYARYMLSDRRLEIDDCLLVNANNNAIATIKYSLPQYEVIASNFEKLNNIEQCQVVLDLSTVFSEKYQDGDDILGFVVLMNKIVKEPKIVNATAFNAALSLFNTLTKSILSVSYFDDQKTYKTVATWENTVISSLLDSFEWEGLDFRQLPATELSVRATLLKLDYSNARSQTIAKKLYKQLLHGPKGAVPVKLVAAVLNNVQAGGSAKEYKEILGIVKNPDSVSDHVYEEHSTADVRTAALTSLGYVTKSDLQQKTLNYVLNNMDTPSVELALVGLKHQPEAFATIWAWFSMHYNGFYAKFMKDSKNQSFIRSFRGIVQLVFESCLCSKELAAKLESFLKAKKFEPLNGEFQRVRAAFGDRLKLNEANSQLSRVIAA
ncbi:hypothetical protein KL928_001342 [Ogataea angusta]|uniref:Aminopeptidase n=1 Tax=Pichia angusta TaxID=870730 RepID=A0AAN6DKN8_PICAN|nr:uncharacterized protein KL928_001342 [Ogataea angusta]KAG7821258.1 hypothetical protein KL928_001342 [Ogataea angusta]